LYTYESGSDITVGDSEVRNLPESLGPNDALEGAIVVDASRTAGVWLRGNKELRMGFQSTDRCVCASWNKTSDIDIEKWKNIFANFLVLHKTEEGENSVNLGLFLFVCI
jgi:hypothetical protein